MASSAPPTSPGPAPPPLEALRRSQAQLMPHLNLATLLPALSAHGLLSREEADKVNDERHHSIIERSSYLLGFILRKGDPGLATFIKCLREETSHAGHATALRLLLQQSSQDEPAGSPVLSILDAQLPVFEMQLNLTACLNALVKEGVISLQEYTKISNTGSDEPKREILKRLLAVLRNKGVSGFIRFYRCLLMDASHEHKLITTILNEEVHKFFSEDPRRTHVPDSDRAALLKLVERQERTKGQSAPRLPTTGLGGQPVLEGGPGAATAAPHTVEKHDRLAVMVCMDRYVKLRDDYATDEFWLPRTCLQYLEHREKLQKCLLRLNFRVVEFAPYLNRAAMETGVSKDFSEQMRTQFKEQIVAQCHASTVLFLYISGIQFPYKIDPKSTKLIAKYAGAILTQDEAIINRNPYASIRVSDLLSWVELLPTPLITFLIDSHHSHVAAFAEVRGQAKEVDITEEPWRNLTGPHSKVVVYYLKPDVEAMARMQEKMQEVAFGKLTEQFTKALISQLRRNPRGVSHRRFYEAVSFHWHKQGRRHLLYTPAIQGDVDRIFLDSNSAPYHQVFRADLQRVTVPVSRVRPSPPPTSTPDMFNLSQLQIPTGTLAGFTKGDELEVFHVLQPEVAVSGRVLKATQLSAQAEVREEDRGKFARVLADIYGEEDNCSSDGSTEFVYVKKRFPFHMREQFSVHIDEELVDSDSGTLKDYIKESSMLLSVAPAQQSANAIIVVRKDGQFLAVEDQSRELAVPCKVQGVQRVKSMLEMLAWFKYVLRLRQQQRSAQLQDIVCHLTADKPLLSRAMPISKDFDLKYTSYTPPFDSCDAVLNFSDPPAFWQPDPADPHPCLEVQFRENHILTAVELRGDSHVNKFVSRVGLTYQKQVLMKQSIFKAASHDDATHSIDPRCSEPVKYITFHPLRWRQGECFAASLRVKVRLMGEQNKTVTKDLESLTVANYGFHMQNHTPWHFVPVPNEMGIVALEPKYFHWLKWTGETNDPLTLMLPTPMLLDRIEVTAPTDAIHLEQFELVLHTDWLKEEPPTIASAWPTRHTFPLPLVLSTLQLWPLEGEVRLQLQLHGNKHGEQLVVEEGDILAFHLCNYTHHRLFVYLFCLEETGMVKLLFCEVVEGMRNGHGGKPIKKLLRTEIPPDYDPPQKEIQDWYRVIVSPKKLYLEPFLQRSLIDYHAPISYAVSSYGPRFEIGQDELWHDYEFKVTVKKIYT